MTQTTPQNTQGGAQQIVPQESPSAGLRRSIVRLIVLIVLLIAILALIKLGFSRISNVRGFGGAPSYQVYVDIPVTLLFAVFIVFTFADVIYWNLRLRLPHPEAASVRPVLRIIGLVAAIVAVTASFVSATAAAALGALAGIVIGLSTQQVFPNTSRDILIQLKTIQGHRQG